MSTKLKKGFLDLHAEVKAKVQVKTDTALAAFLADRMKAKNAAIKTPGRAELINDLLTRIFGPKDESEMTKVHAICGVLVCENSCRIEGDPDKALYGAIRCISDRLRDDPVVQDPIAADKKLADGKDDLIIRLSKRFEEVLKILEVLKDKECAEIRAVEAWCKVFPDTSLCDLLRKIKSEIGKNIRAGKIVPATVGGGVVVTPTAPAVPNPPRAHGESGYEWVSITVTLVEASDF